MKILVTGSTGVLGSAIKLISPRYADCQFVFISSQDCDLIDAKETLETIGKYRPDAILHLAAVSGGIGLSMKHPATVLRDNTLMSFSILEAARKCKVKKIVMTLTAGMYPKDAPLPLREEYIHNGYPHQSNYGLSFAKRIIEPAIRAYRQEYKLNVIGLVPGGIYGEHDNFNEEEATMVPSLINKFFKNRNSSGKIEVWGDGSPLREYTYAGDLAEIYLWCLKNYNEEQVLNIGSTEEHSVGEIAYMIADILGISRERVYFNKDKPSGIQRKSTDNSRFLALSNFNYTPLKEGLEKTICWFRQACENNPDTLRLANRTRPRP